MWIDPDPRDVPGLAQAKADCNFIAMRWLGFSIGLALVLVSSAASALPDDMPRPQLWPFDQKLADKMYGIDRPPHRPGRVACDWIPSCRPCTLSRIVGGDTLMLNCGEGEPLAVRLSGVDAPETGARAACEKERLWGEDAKRFLTEWLPAAAKLDAIFLGTDRNGRAIAMLRYDETDVGAELVWHGHAKPWPKNANKPNWCD